MWMVESSSAGIEKQFSIKRPCFSTISSHNLQILYTLTWSLKPFSIEQHVFINRTASAAISRHSAPEPHHHYYNYQANGEILRCCLQESMEWAWSCSHTAWFALLSDHHCLGSNLACGVWASCQWLGVRLMGKILRCYLPESMEQSWSCSQRDFFFWVTTAQIWRMVCEQVASDIELDLACHGEHCLGCVFDTVS